MSDNSLRIERLSNSILQKKFECSNDDLTDFFYNDALPHQEKLLAVTNVLIKGDDIIAFYSTLNDKISIEDVENGTKWTKLKKLWGVKAPKSYKSYPAVKIGRLGVDRRYKRKNYGTAILDYIKITFITNNRTGCKFITLDAYNKPDVISFYRKNQFEFLTNNDQDENTRLMYFDLMKVADVEVKSER
jgi:GNAT superfamily N-acetyltransferase